MKIEIDKGSGFCFGVVTAIRKAEEVLERDGKLYCLGDIVHNNVEVERLQARGLVTIEHEQFKELKNCTVLIRAHGEPPETYTIAKENNITLIDATCPVVLKLQKKIKTGFEDIIEKQGQTVIYGKEGHAEVNGLVGQTSGKAIVISSLSDLDKLDFTKPINLYAQTTQSISGLADIVNEMKSRFAKISDAPNMLSVNDTICRQVSNRDIALKEFAKKHDVIIFVSGKKSSNGKVLYEVCKLQNEQTYFVSDTNELNPTWFHNVESVGICGATSTPLWLMQKIRDCIDLL